MGRHFNLLAAALAFLAAFVAACSGGPDSADDRPVIESLQTPAASGSMGPNLAAGMDGRPVLSWLEPAGSGHALRYAVYDEGTWGEARTVAVGDNWFVNWADFPSVVPISETLWAAHWLVRREAGGYAYDIHAAFSSDAGKTWSEPFVPHTDGTDTEHGFVSLYPDPRGIGMIWLDGRNMVNEYDEHDVAASGMTLRAGVFSPHRAALTESLVDELICDCCQTDVAVTDEGPVAVYRNRTVGEIRDIYVTRYVEGAWQAGEPVADDGWEIAGCPVNGPVVQANGSNLAVAWFSAANGEAKVRLAGSGDAGATMSTPLDVASGEILGHVGAAMLPGGDVAVAWLRKSGGDGAELHLRRITPSGRAGTVRVVAENVASFSVPQVVRAGDGLLLAWTDASGDESAVRTALVGLPVAIENGP